jgi:hypothetical protein
MTMADDKETCWQIAYLQHEEEPLVGNLSWGQRTNPWTKLRAYCWVVNLHYLKARRCHNNVQFAVYPVLVVPSLHSLAFPNLSALPVILSDASAPERKIWGRPGVKGDSEVRQIQLSFIVSSCESRIDNVIETICRASPLRSAICSSTCHVIRFERCFIHSASPFFHWHRIPLFFLPSTYSRESMNNFFRISAEYSAGLGGSK